MTICLTLKPHIERGGFHTERFDALVDGEIVCISRSGWHDPSRALLAKGYPPETLLHVRHEGRELDPTIVPQSIGELAKVTHTDTALGIKKISWVPSGERFAALRRSTHPLPESENGAAGVVEPAEARSAP